MSTEQTETVNENSELEAFKAQVHDVASRACADYGWCDEIDRMLERLGLPKTRRRKAFTVQTTATVPVSYTVHAFDDDEALNLAREHYEYDKNNQSLEYGRFSRRGIAFSDELAVQQS